MPEIGQQEVGQEETIYDPLDTSRDNPYYVHLDIMFSTAKLHKHVILKIHPEDTPHGYNWGVQCRTCGLHGFQDERTSEWDGPVFYTPCPCPLSDLYGQGRAANAQGTQ